MLDAQGHVIGSIVYTASTSLKPPFKSSYGLLQKDGFGKVIVEGRR